MKIDLLASLKESKTFSSLPKKALNFILQNSEVISIHKGKILLKQDELTTELYVLLSGKLAVYLKTQSVKTLISEVIPGQTVGELAALSHTPRSATVKAVKNSQLLKIPSEVFIKLCNDNPSFMQEILYTSMAQSREVLRLLREQGGAVRNHIAIVPASLEMDMTILHQEMQKYAKQFSNVVFLSDLDEMVQKKNLTQLRKYVDNIDSKKIIIYLIQSYRSHLAEICFGYERVDMVYVVAYADSEPFIHAATLRKIKTNSYKINPELILLHRDSEKAPQNTKQWLKLARFNLHHHIRIDIENDWQRLYRFITGTAVGIVLGGGGLRCWAQLGALRALQKKEIPIDIICGTSAGSIVAGYYAMDGSLTEIEGLRKLSAATRNSVKLKNLTWPAVSIFNGEEYTKQLKKIFGKIKIENLWIPFFCVSTSLSNNKVSLSRSGPLWKAIRSSTSVPLVFPPVVMHGKIYLDGGLLNNLPVNIMKKFVAPNGKVIAVELTHRVEDVNKYNFPEVLPFLSTMFTKAKLIHKKFKFPTLTDLFLKSLLAGATAKQEENAAMADVLITPDLSEYSLLHIKREDEDLLIKIGYKETIKKIKKI